MPFLRGALSWMTLIMDWTYLNFQKLIFYKWTMNVLGWLCYLHFGLKYLRLEILSTLFLNPQYLLLLFCQKKFWKSLHFELENKNIICHEWTFAQKQKFEPINKGYSHAWRTKKRKKSHLAILYYWISREQIFSTSYFKKIRNNGPRNAAKIMWKSTNEKFTPIWNIQM